MLTAVWEDAGYPWSVRLKALLPSWMPWIRKPFRVSPEVDLVSHSGNSASGEFAHTLNVTDIHTTWNGVASGAGAWRRSRC